MKTKEVIQHIQKWLKDYKNKNSNIKGFVVGVSGGIDSAVVSTLCASTGIPLLVLEMPIHQSKPEVQRSTRHQRGCPGLESSLTDRPVRRQLRQHR